MAKKNEGKIFEQQLQESAKSLNIFFTRIKDQFLPPDVRSRVPVAKNDYDCLMFSGNHLFPLELKSTKSKSFSFDEKIIKKHQIEKLTEAATYDGVIAGFIFNFREPDNLTYFVDIHSFLLYKRVAESNGEFIHTIKSKINKNSIPIDYCEEVGIKINNYKKRTNYHYHVKEFVDEAIKRFGGDK